MKFFITLLLISLVISFESNASCMDVIHGKELVEKSDIVFEGMALELKGVPREFASLVVFQIDRMYKNDDYKKKTIEIIYRNPSHAGEFPLGKKFLVFSWLDKQGKFMASECSMNFLDLENLKRNHPNKQTLDTLEALQKKFPIFDDPVVSKWVEDRKNQRSFFENLFGRDF